MIKFRMYKHSEFFCKCVVRLRCEGLLHLNHVCDILNHGGDLIMRKLLDKMFKNKKLSVIEWSEK